MIPVIVAVVGLLRLSCLCPFTCKFRLQPPGTWFIIRGKFGCSLLIQMNLNKGCQCSEWGAVLLRLPVSDRLWKHSYQNPSTSSDCERAWSRACKSDAVALYRDYADPGYVIPIIDLSLITISHDLYSHVTSKAWLCACLHRCMLDSIPTL